MQKYFYNQDFQRINKTAKKAVKKQGQNTIKKDKKLTKMSADSESRRVSSGGITVSLDLRQPFAVGCLEKNTDMAMMLVLAGTAKIEIDFRQYDLSANQLLMLPPSSFSRCTEQSDDFTVSGFTLSQAITQELTSRFEPAYFGFLTEYPAHTPPMDDVAYIRNLITTAGHMLENSDQEHSMQKAKLLIQCFYLDQYDHCKNQITPRNTEGISNQEHLFMRFLTLVHENASRQRDVAFYADRLCISKRYLSAILRNQTGKTVKDFVDNRCIQEIKILLRTTDEPLQNIAFDLNFPDQSFFSRYFKKNTGMTPTEFRAQ